MRCFLIFTLLIIYWSPARSRPGEPFGHYPLLRGKSAPGVNLNVGFRGGINFSQPFVMDRSEVLQSDNPSTAYEKDYSPVWDNIGYHYAFVMLTYLNESLSLSVEPAIATYNYRYELSTDWTNGTDATDYIHYETKHRNGVSYIEIPVVLRYEFGGGRIQPFASLGFTYGYRMSASKKMDYTVTRHTGDLTIPYENSSQTGNNAGTYIHSRFGIAPGIGFFYPLGTVKLLLSADFCFPLNNITDESERFSNSSVTSGMYDVQDDIRLGALNITVGILFNTGSMQSGSTGRKRGGKALECIDFNRKR